MRVPASVKRRAIPLLYRRPVSGLAHCRLYAYLDELHALRSVPGAVVEIGCHLGGTSAIAHGFLGQIGTPRRYVAVDTFDGFVDGQLEHDVQIGVPRSTASWFEGNSLPLVRRLLTRYGAAEVELIQGDICELEPDQLPDQIAVALIDVDLTEPIRCALDKVHPRMVPGGRILVDDCPEHTSWVGARREYTRWMDEHGLDVEFRFGFGCVST